MQNLILSGNKIGFFQPCAHLLGKGWPLGVPVCDVSLLLLSLAHIVSLVRCGTWLYRFLIFAFFFTFFKIMECLWRIGIECKMQQLGGCVGVFYRSEKYAIWLSASSKPSLVNLIIKRREPGILFISLPSWFTLQTSEHDVMINFLCRFSVIGDVIQKVQCHHGLKKIDNGQLGTSVRTRYSMWIRI